MKSVCFFIQNLNGGGAERVALNLMNNLDRKKFIVELIILENKGAYLKKLKEDIKVKKFNQLLKIRSLNFILNILKSLLYLKHQEIIFSQYHPGKILSFFIPFMCRKKVTVYRETNLPTEITNISTYSIKLLDKLFYKYGIYNYSKIIVQSEDMRKDLLSILKKNTPEIIVINNPVDCNALDNEDKDKDKDNNFYKNNKKIKLISIGRLNQQKGYDLLIKTLSKIDKNKYELLILGEGNEREKLEKLILDNELQNNIKLIGFKKNPYNYLKQSDFFISSSRFEGFPNSVIEANYFGIPVIANNYRGGINEIILENINGKIIDIRNHEKFEEALMFKYQKNRIKEITKERYDIDKISKKYENIFNTSEELN